MYYHTETSKRMFNLNPDCSQSTFRDSARQALQASKHQDGSLHMSTPFYNMQSKKVANLKQKLKQLNSNHASSLRCPSNLNDSSAASITAATSCVPTQNGQNAKYGYQQRPISSNSYMLESSCQNNNNQNHHLRHSNTFVTDLNDKDLSNHSVQDLSPLRVSNLASNNSRGASKGNNNKRQADYKKVGNHSVVQAARKRHNMSSIVDGYSTMNQRTNQATRNYEYLNNKVRNSSNSVERNHSGNINRSTSFYKGGSVQSNRTNQSSPERLVNIVCPPSQQPKNRVEGQKIIRKASRPRSDIRNKITSSSFMGSEKLKKGFKQVKALGSSFGISDSSQQNILQSKHNKAAKKRMVTPSKQQRSQSSISYSRSKSKSHSRLRGGSRSRCSQMSTPNYFSTNISAKKLQLNRRIASSNKEYVARIRRSASKQSNYSRSLPSDKDLSNNSNMKQQQSLQWQQRSSDCMNRDERRVNKYLKNQTNSSSVQKSFNFTSIEADSGLPEHQIKQHKVSKTYQNAFIGQQSGQITGKFRSLNEPALKQIIKSSQKQLKKENQLDDKASKIQNVGFDSYDLQIVNRKNNANLRTEDDYCETLTASSEDSPMRPSQRVQRAAALTTKAYLEDVNQRVENANHHANSIRQFGPRKMKVAYQGINQRQGARLQAMKQQMQESLIETHELQSKLQSSACDSKQARKGGVSQFNSLVLEFSQSLENKAIDMIQATESKRKNQKMKEMIAELQEIRRVRSGSKSMPVSARKRKSGSSGKKAKSSSNRSRSRNHNLSRASLRSRSNSTSKKSLRSRSNSKSKKDRKLGCQKRSRSAKKLGLKSRQKSKSQRSMSNKSKRSMSKSAKSVRSGKSIKSVKSARSLRSGKSASSRGRSRSIRKKIKSVKRNIFKQTNGFTDSSQVTLGQIKQRSRLSLSKKNSKSRSKSMKKGGRMISNGRSQSRDVNAKSFNRVQELGQKCSRLITNKFNGTNKAQSMLIRRSMSKNKARTTQVSKSRSKSTKRNMFSKKSPSRSKSRSKSTKRNMFSKKSPSRSKSRSKSTKRNMVRKKNKSRSKSRSKSKKKQMVRKRSLSRSKSARKSKAGSKSPTNSQVQWDFNVTPKITPQITPCMTPLHKILRNQMPDNEMQELRGVMNRYSENSQVKKVKIQSQRLRDITQLTSSDDSDSSYDSEDSLDNNRYLKRQQAHLSPWQRACILKQLPKKFR